MLRINWLATALIAVAGLLITALPTASAAPSSGHQIKDSFNGSTIDPDVWGSFGSSDQPAVSIAQANGALTFTIGANASNDFNSWATTRCSAVGDFDARIAFVLPQWTIDNGVTLSLMAANTGGFNVFRASWQFAPGDAYGAYLPPSGGGTAPAENGNSGKLRMTRTGNVWTGYYRNGTSWVSLGSGPGPTTPIQFNLAVFNLSGVLPFGGNPTTISVDRFRVTADQIAC